MSYLIEPKKYRAMLDLQQTELGIKRIKEFFQENLSASLRLRRVTAPLFVLRGMGINDDLNGVENAVAFPITDMGGQAAEIVHSLAKWKRLTLADYKIKEGFGIYTDMNAIRADEELGNLHSLYVDQWDWEKVMSPQNRSLDFLKDVVDKIYSALVMTEYLVYESFPEISPILPPEITFIQAEELRREYPHLSPKEREHEIAKKYGAVFIIGIGGILGDGKSHDGRAPDYDDWTSQTEGGFQGLNGDLIVWYPVLGCSVELSSMGIRVNEEVLKEQLRISNKEDRQGLYFHKRLLEGELPQTIGGGIGQSRLCMFFLRKGHIGEIQAGIWPQAMRSDAEKLGMQII